MNYTLTIEDTTVELSSEDVENLDVVAKDNSIHMIVDSKSIEAQLVSFDRQSKSVIVNVGGKEFTVEIKDELDALVDKLGFTTETASVIKDIKAPMPGLVLELLVNIGDSVEKGTQLLILEAMKMENVLKSQGEGVIKQIEVKTGDAVEKNQLLIVLE